MKVETIVIGGGVVGLAIAAKLSDNGQEVVLLEKEARLGEATSSRNSGVIHAGIYYPKNSLKAELCVSGKNLLYDYAKQKNVTHKKIGKFIVANKKEDNKKLKTLKEQGDFNGVKDLTLLSKEDLVEQEPDVLSEGALFSGTTGMIDAAELMFSLENDFLKTQGMISLNSEVTNIKTSPNEHQIFVQADEKFIVKTKNIINCAGLNATKVAQKISGLKKSFVPEMYFAKGHYYQLTGKHNFSHLIYPLPNAHGLGIHLSIGLDGRAKFGPDVTWVDKIDYSFDETLHDKFLQSIKLYWPHIDGSKLQPDYTGIRPKIYGPEEQGADFVIQGKEKHNIKGLINLFGIESPGLTSSLAIADRIMDLI